MSNGGRVQEDTAKDHQQLVVRPSQRVRYGRSQSVGAAAWILASLLYSFRFNGSTRVVVIAAGVIVAVCLIGVMNLSLRRTKLTMVDGQLILSGLLRDHVLLVGEGRGRVVNVEVVWGNTAGRRSRLWLLMDPTGQTAVGLNRDTWNDGQLESLRESLGLPLDVDDTPKRPGELRNAYPGSIAWWAVHPTVTFSLVIIVVAVLVLALQDLTF
jgi:hypothetical protein